MNLKQYYLNKLYLAPPIKQEQFDLILKSISTKDKIEIIEYSRHKSSKVLQKLLENTYTGSGNKLYVFCKW